MSEERKAKIGFIDAGTFATKSIYPNIHLCPQDHVILKELQATEGSPKVSYVVSVQGDSSTSLRITSE